MKKLNRVYAVGLILIMLLSACQKEQIDLADSQLNLNLNNNEELSGELTINTYFDGYMLQRALAFMELHPNVKIRIPGFDNIENLTEENYETLEMYAKRISTELMSGMAGDLVDVADLSYYKYAKSNLLCNLYQFMDNDKAFSKQDYYTNIFKAMEYKKGLYTLPLAFYYDMVFINKVVFNTLDLKINNYPNICLKNMLDIYDLYQNQNPNSPIVLMPGLAKNIFFKYEIADFFSFENGTANFTDSDFINYLKRTSSLKVEDSWKMNRVSAGDDSYIKNRFLFSKTDLNVVDAHNLLIEYQYVTQPVPFYSSKGDACFNSAQAVYAIPKSSQNKELAWHFLKFCIEQKNINEQNLMDRFYDYNGFMPINKANFYNFFKTFIKMDLKDLKQHSVKIVPNTETALEQTLKIINKWNEQRNKISADFELWALVKQDLDLYYKNQILSPEKLAELIQNKVLIYLNE
ncbi:extracellular solute-binding protein [Clostridium sp. 'deep sea']|uniref:extracellular solute-binding protein n=1 Tax=Clostridium sp. 'deep sea' TaxID=2779445 RepID=UPI001896744E|nr:extracellular solute-binding protein [Clostridium sp. 'deep sea']QOR34923.1 extracellular solute-binding protein [Clostridium sp. 'deep sea']